MDTPSQVVDYESFGAKGDGKTDDLPAICRAHAHANGAGLPVRSRPDATYHLGRQALTATVATDTDWNASRFVIDDSEPVEDHRAALFEVVSLLEPPALTIDRLARDQRHLELAPQHDCMVRVEFEGRRVYIRRGLNQNAGVPQSDCFVLQRDGTIEGDIDWDYDEITGIETWPIDDETLHLRGGVFETVANREHHPDGYNYWSRNIVVKRSNTIVDGLIHYVVGETDVGCPYSGFLSARNCARITFQDCWSTPHKMYSTIGAAGKPVNMGSYDLGANNVVGFTMRRCRMNLINDRTRWGVIGSNFCKDILLEDCHLSRMDTHQGVSGSYVIRRCELGHMGLNAIGRGQLLIEDSTLYGRNLVNFRSDYGSTWEGELEIRNCRWIPAGGDAVVPYAIGVSNDGMHDFGYPCSMPRQVIVDGLYVDDSNTPEGHEGMYWFSDPDAAFGEGELPVERPYPYAACERLTVRGLETASGKDPKLSPNPALTTDVEAPTSAG